LTWYTTLSPEALTARSLTVAPTDAVLLVVLWRLRYAPGLRDRAGMFRERGFGPLLAARLRARWRGAAGAKWPPAAPDVRVAGRRCHLYRAIAREGYLVDARPRPTRDMDAAQRLFRQARARAGDAPAPVTTDGTTPARARAARRAAAAPIAAAVHEYADRAGPPRAAARHARASASTSARRPR